MRKFTFCGEDIYLTESQWRGLLGRFDVKNIRQEYDMFKINIPCNLCKEERLGGCRGCPFDEVGCTYAVRSIGSVWLAKSLHTDHIMWGQLQDRFVREGIEKIHKFLLGLPKTRRTKL